jgi:single-strand DNA-binding protein
MKNRVQMIGNLGMNPELSKVNNSSIAKFSIANSERWQNDKGEWQENTYWHNVVAWGKTGERLAESLQKGDRIALEGKLVSKSYEDKNGTKHYVTEIVLSAFERVAPPTKKEMQLVQ